MAVPVDSPVAQSWCMVGAVIHTALPDAALAAHCYALLEEANPFGLDLTDVNDAEMLGHEAVLLVYDTAIARLHETQSTPRPLPVETGMKGAHGQRSTESSTLLLAQEAP